MIVYIPPEELILELHDGVLEMAGGRPGILDKNKINAAVTRPKTYLVYHPECDLHTICAVILDSIARNHAFADGNKRTGLMAALLTYELNGYKLSSTADDAGEYEDLVLWVVKDKPDISEISKRLEVLANKYLSKGMSVFVKSLRNKLTPHSDEE